MISTKPANSALQPIRWGAAGLLLLLLLGVTTTRLPAQVPPENATSGASGTAPRLDAGDLLEITTFDTPDLSGKFRVGGDGDIVLPVGGTLQVQGLTAAQAAAAVEKRFRQDEIVRSPHVTVLVLEYATQGISVLGEVKSPGVYPLTGKHGVLDFISTAGGLTPLASKAVTLTHKDPPWTTVTVNLSSPNGVELQNDVEVQPGDRMVALRAGVVYVLGDVGKPGGYVLGDKQTTTVLEALAQAQGVNRTAKSTGSLLRNLPTGRVTTQLALNKILASQAPDPRLQDGDILYVPVSTAKDWSNKGVTAILQMAVGVVIYGRL